MGRFAVVALLVVAGCRRPTPVGEISVADAAKQFASALATPIDANTDEYRDGAGWVPGAVLLSSFNEFPASELPQDTSRPLVFYCTSRM